VSKDFFDSDGYLHSEAGQTNAENAIMYSIMYNEFTPKKENTVIQKKITPGINSP
jgi:hypothetical protein